MLEQFDRADLKRQRHNMLRGSCPNHSKKNKNLMVFENENGGLNVYCHAGCSESEIMDGLGLERAALFPPRPVDINQYREFKAEKRRKEAIDDKAMDLWIELLILTQVLEARIFGGDTHPDTKMDCWQREQQALRILPKLLKEYYK